MSVNSIKSFLYKGCARCHGDLALDIDVDPTRAVESLVEYVCLQCGRRAAAAAATKGKELAIAAAA